jgi:hypothetical protein
MPKLSEYTHLIRTGIPWFMPKLSECTPDSDRNLADAIGATSQTNGLIEKGDYSPSVTLALKVAKTLNMTL